MLIILLCGLLVHSAAADLSSITKSLYEPKDLEQLMVDLASKLPREDITCVAVVCDTVYLNVFEETLFRTWPVPFVMIVVEENEDLLSPNFYTLESLRAARTGGCNVYIILLANALQTTRLLRFGDRYRILDMRAKFIMLHDFRLFHSDHHFLWKRIVNVIFLRYHWKIGAKTMPWFDISTVPFPNPIKGVFISQTIDIWKNRKFHYNRPLFSDKAKDLNGEVLNVVYLDHVPSVVVNKSNDTREISGVEIEILKTLAEKMNFKPKLYQPIHADVYKWGQMESNGTFSGLLGEIVHGKADIALGNLQYTPYHLDLTDLSIPYTSQCWTFVTPEALTDNSWKTLILPFKLYMWVAVLLVLFITGAIFYGLANVYLHLLRYREAPKATARPEKDTRHDGKKPTGLYLFGEIINSILYTYGMLLVVSLPKLPTGFSIQLLTGWYWLYCILIVVSYRASMTAILANPAPRVTIDTLRELVDSKIKCGGWGLETKRFFEKSQDEIVQKIGEKFENINDADEAADKVAKGIYAYYDNAHFLKYLSIKKNNGLMNVGKESYSSIENNVTLVTSESDLRLHIMSDCVINTPVSIGFHKNSPVKLLSDIYLRRIIEVGLIEKWLNDAMHSVRSLDVDKQEIKALMNLKKLHAAFVALGIGYSVSVITLMCELIHWNLIVKRDPRFDKYALDLYYLKKQ